MAGILAAPAVVQAASLMPVRAIPGKVAGWWDFGPGVYIPVGNYVIISNRLWLDRRLPFVRIGNEDYVFHATDNDLTIYKKVPWNET